MGERIIFIADRNREIASLVIIGLGNKTMLGESVEINFRTIIVPS